jgi:hypothetical protein
MLKVTKEINIEVKIEKCSMNVIWKNYVIKCSNKREQQKGKNKRKV